MKKILYCLVVSVLALSVVPVHAEQLKSKTNNSNLLISNSVFKNAPKSIDNLTGNFDHKIDIIFSDIDGTLLGFNKQKPKPDIPEPLKQSVQKLKKAGIPLILTSGRGYVEEHEIAQMLGNSNTYLIANQGAEIIDPQGKIIYQDSIKKNDVKKILKKIDSIKKANNFTSNVVVFANGKVYATERFKLPYNWEEITILKSFDELKDSKVCKICFSESNPKTLRVLQSELKKDFPEYHIDISADCYCDVSSATATKGNAVKKLAEILKMDLKNTATFGDAENDISMLKAVKNSGGLAVSVGNAMDSVKENSSFVTSTVYESGFSKAVDKILINNALVSK